MQQQYRGLGEAEAQEFELTDSELSEICAGRGADLGSGLGAVPGLSGGVPSLGGSAGGAGAAPAIGGAGASNPLAALSSLTSVLGVLGSV